MRCTRRRNEATERSRTSSAASAVTTVSRPRRFSPPAGRVGLGAAAGRTGAPPTPRRGVRGASSSSASSAGRAVWPSFRVAVAVVVVVSVPKRFLATSSALRLVSSSCLRRTSSLTLRVFRGRAIGPLGFLAGTAYRRLLLGALALFVFAQLRAGQCMGARAAFLFGQRAQHDAGFLRGGSWTWPWPALLRQRRLQRRGASAPRQRLRPERRPAPACPRRGRCGV